MQECLLLEEKIIYTLLIYLVNQDVKNETEENKIDINFEEFVVNFVQKVNKIAMEGYEQQGEKDSKIQQKMVNKVVSLLTQPEVEKRIIDVSLFKKLKILSFNNLSCIFKKKKVRHQTDCCE